jgi:uncharacterized membrane protein YhdT
MIELYWSDITAPVSFIHLVLKLLRLIYQHLTLKMNDTIDHGLFSSLC